MRILKITISALLIFSVLFCTYGCKSDDGDYPVTIGNTTFEDSPEKIAVVSPNVADIIDCIGYNPKVVLVSDQVLTESYKDTEKCGNNIDPDVDKIVKSGATVLLADDNISDGTIKKLEEQDIKVVQFHYGNTKDEVKTTYTSIGSILQGKEGKEKAEGAYELLFKYLDTYKDQAKRKNSQKFMMYVSGTGPITTIIEGSWYNTILNYTGTRVIRGSLGNPTVSIGEIADLNPDFLIYDKNTYNTIKNRSVVQECRFLTKGGSLRLDKEYLKLQGTAAIENIRKIISLYDKEAVEKADRIIKNQGTETTTVSSTTTQSSADSSTTTTNSSGSEKETTTTQTTIPQTATTANQTTSTTSPSSKYELQSKYNVNFTESAIDSMKKDKENKYIKAMQQRLSDLGY
ncbi:MAG: ABC transporter substrate-binding protein, partial [Ruminococcus sp.]